MENSYPSQSERRAGDLGDDCPAPYLISWNSNRKAGFVTLIVIILLTTIMGLGLEVYLKANKENLIDRREAQARQALYISEGGLEWAKSNLKSNPYWFGGNYSILGNPIKVTVSTGQGGYWVTSEARAGEAKRKIKVFMSRTTGKWVITHYQELHQ